ncbi:MAG: DUF86 domain-containing protein [Anaerolineae bacterium]|nr:DUF86 domain-containing protein [Anaerolineales bacterium]MCQ3979272.1 DUF86 domain-containing protein [Anaerolineae bacterium]
MRSEEQYLTDIVEAADAIARFIAGIDQAAFLQDELRQSAVIQKIEVIGEAAGKISPRLRDRYPEVEWPRIVGMRNLLVHSYFSIKPGIIWQTATQAVPDLRERIAQILIREFRPD